MKFTRSVILVNLVLLSLTLTGCRRNPGTVWEDTKIAGRHMNRGVRSMGGKHGDCGDSRMQVSREEFLGQESMLAGSGHYTDEYIPLSDDPNISFLSREGGSRPPRESPGERGSSLPGIQSFKDPSIDPRLSTTFRNIQFDYNSSLIKGEANMQTIRNVSQYMRQNPNTYIFVEGHCDERGAEAYNLALGSYRGNSVRDLLIREGVDGDRVFTISYGKERPLVYGSDEDSFRQNRRAEFKVFQR